MPPKRNSPIDKVLGPIRRMLAGLTLGAQGILIDPKDRVLLVRHTYRPGWFFPGGGVEWGEPIEEALARELEEEVGAKLLAPPQLHGVFANFASFPGDHIVVFVARHWERTDVRRDNSEIAEVGLFEGRCLPEATDAGTRRRLQEIFDQLPKIALWA